MGAVLEDFGATVVHFQKTDEHLVYLDGVRRGQLVYLVNEDADQARHQALDVAVFGLIDGDVVRGVILKRSVQQLGGVKTLRIGKKLIN